MLIKVAFTRLRFQHKIEHLVTILAFHLHANDENAYSKWRLLNSETKLETLKAETWKTAIFSRVNTQKRVNTFDTDVP